MGCASTAVKIEKNDKISASTKDSKDFNDKRPKAKTTLK